MKRQEIEKLIDIPLEDLLTIANKTRRDNLGNKLEICSIINAKSGICSEDCKFCAQSSHYSTTVKEYSLKSNKEILKAAEEAKKNGAVFFGIVTSGNRLTAGELDMIADTVTSIKDMGITPCASLGALDDGSFRKLKDAGLSRYHHNIETSESFYPNIVSTHDYSERVETIRRAKNGGLEVCSGGIFGLGEIWRDRIDMAFLLKELNVDSVPLNFLVPIKGTPMEARPAISAIEAIKIIALFRIILNATPVKVAAGRELILKDFQGMMFNAGVTGMMVGGYLTVKGRAVKDDLTLINEIRTLWKTA